MHLSFASAPMIKTLAKIVNVNPQKKTIRKIKDCNSLNMTGDKQSAFSLLCSLIRHLLYA